MSGNCITLHNIEFYRTLIGTFSCLGIEQSTMIRHHYKLILLLLLTSLVISCQKSEIEYENQFDKSYKAWISFKKASNNSYKYTVNGSTWVGPAWQTVITVVNGKITQRHFRYTALEGFEDHIPQEALEWTEDENEIDSHEHAAAAEPLTLDQIYDHARNIWLKKRKDGKTYFEAKNNGLISSCGFVPDNCADDCFSGISIGSIEKI